MKRFMEIGPHIFPKSGRQTDTRHTQTDGATHMAFGLLVQRYTDVTI